MYKRQHQSDDNPLVDVGLKDITAHVNFTAMALAAQDQPLPHGQGWSVGNWRTAQRLSTPLWCGQASYPPGVQARPWHRHWWGLGRAGAGLRDGDEKRFGSYTGNRIAL